MFLVAFRCFGRVQTIVVHSPTNFYGHRRVAAWVYRRLKNKYFSIDKDAEAADAARCPLFGAEQIVQTRHRLFAAEVNDQQERFLCLWLCTLKNREWRGIGADVRLFSR